MPLLISQATEVLDNGSSSTKAFQGESDAWSTIDTVASTPNNDKPQADDFWENPIPMLVSTCCLSLLAPYGRIDASFHSNSFALFTFRLHLALLLEKDSLQYFQMRL
jgi:hypothetical protein